MLKEEAVSNRGRTGWADLGAITKLLELLLDLIGIGIRPQLERCVVVFPGVHHGEHAGGTRQAKSGGSELIIASEVQRC